MTHKWNSPSDHLSLTPKGSRSLSFNHIFKQRSESAQQEGKLQTGGESKKAEEEGLYTTVPLQEADIYHLGELQELVSGILTASFCFMQHAACRGASTELNPLC